MMNTLTKLFGALLLGVVLCSTALAAEIDAVQGKWKADQELNGQKVVFHLDVKGDKFRFEAKSSDGASLMIAKGKVKVEQNGPFKTLVLHGIEWGQNESDLQPVDDTRSYAYVSGWQSMTLAGNFDRERDNEKPSITIYRKD